MKKLNKNSRIAEVADIANRMVYLFEKETVIKNDEVLKKVFADISQSSAKIFLRILRAFVFIFGLNFTQKEKS